MQRLTNERARRPPSDNASQQGAQREGPPDDLVERGIRDPSQASDGTRVSLAPQQEPPSGRKQDQYTDVDERMKPASSAAVALDALVRHERSSAIPVSASSQCQDRSLDRIRIRPQDAPLQRRLPRSPRRSLLR